MEQKNLLVEGKVLQIKKLVNLVDIGCKVKNFKWTFELVKKYYRFVQKEYSFYTMQVFISTQSFIRNQKEIPKERKKSYQNFIQLLINLYKVRHQEGRITLTRVKEKMAKMDLIDRKKWLLEKIKELSYRG